MYSEIIDVFITVLQDTFRTILFHKSFLANKLTHYNLWPICKYRPYIEYVYTYIIIYYKIIW